MSPTTRKREFISWEKRVFRAILHVPVGVVIAFSPLLHWTLPLVLTFLFWRYEANEDKWIGDQAFYDLFGAIIGLVGMIIILLVLAKGPLLWAVFTGGIW